MFNTKQCLYCSKEFEPRRGGPEQLYCSRRCCKMYWRKISGKEKNRLITKRQTIKSKTNPTKRFNSIKYQANIRHHLFSLTYEQFLTFWNKKCYYCDNEIIGIGIDRIDNNIGYELTNCIPCCTICNKMKNTQSQSDFIYKCKIIADKFSNQFTKGTDEKPL